MCIVQSFTLQKFRVAKKKFDGNKSASSTSMETANKTKNQSMGEKKIF